MNKDENAKGIVDVPVIADNLATYAKKLKDSGELHKQLASTLIYAELAEYYCTILIEWLEKNLKRSIQVSSVVNLSWQKSKNITKANLGSQLKKLEIYTYPLKQEFEDTVDIIKEARNAVFHNLVTAHVKGINIKTKMVVIQDQTELLRRILTKILIKLL